MFKPHKILPHSAAVSHPLLWQHGVSIPARLLSAHCLGRCSGSHPPQGQTPNGTCCTGNRFSYTENISWPELVKCFLSPFVLHLKERQLLWRKSQGGVQKLAGWQVHVQLCLREIHRSIFFLGSAHHFSQSRRYTRTRDEEVFWGSIKRVWIKCECKNKTHFETSLSACRDFSSRENMRIWKTLGSIIKVDTRTALALCIKKGSHRMGSYQFCDHDWPKRCQVLGRNPQQENTKHQEHLGWNGVAGVHTQSFSETLWKRFLNGWIRNLIYYIN